MKIIKLFTQLTIALLFLASIVGCGSGPTVSKSTSSLNGDLTTAGPDSFFKDIQAGKERVFTGIPVNAREAKAKTGIEVRLANDTKLTGGLKGIYAYIPSAEETKQDARMGLAIHYSGGIDISEEACPKEPDWAAETAVPTFNGRPPDVVTGAIPVRCKVAGFSGMANAEWTSGGTKLPPQLHWWENGVRYHIMPWKLGYTSEQLMQIAESMY